eukprot:jgi/Ulvmu1/6724/UM030_0057.1
MCTALSCRAAVLRAVLLFAVLRAAAQLRSRSRHRHGQRRFTVSGKPSTRSGCMQAQCTDFETEEEACTAWLPAAEAAVAEAVVECDVLVIGSGSGGGVAAAVLAAAGLRVLVAEKGPYMDPTELPRADDAAFSAVYENAGALQTTDTGAVILAGTGIGGGSRINWCASFRTPPHVRREWAQQHGAAFVDTAAYTRALDVVCGRLGVHTAPDYQRDRSATTLKAGATALGRHFDMIPQNCSTPEACEKHCAVGCAAGGKRDTARAFLAPAAASGNVAVLCHTGAARVLTEDRDAGSADGDSGRPRRAVGAVLHMETNEAGVPSSARGGRVGASTHVVTVAVRARAVVSAAGALHTPALLLRSGVRGRGNVGRHLRIHPATFIMAELPAETHTLTEVLDAPMMSVYSRATARWPPLDTPETSESNGRFDTDGPQSGYGAFVSVSAAPPGLILPLMPFQDRFQSLRNVLHAPNLATIVCYTRDQGRGGRVVLNSEGQPKVSYSASRATQRAMGEAVDYMLRCAHAAGATRMLTAHDSYTEFSRDLSRSILFDTARVPSIDSRRNSGRGSADSGPGSRRTSDPNPKPAASASSPPPLRLSDVSPRGAPLQLEPSLRRRSMQSVTAAPGMRDADAFDRWREGVRRKGFSPLRLQHVSAHQMGTARMGADPNTSAVDPQGQSWDVQGLWVADASVFPTASGVNPMVTIEALALCIAQHAAGSLLGDPFVFEDGLLPDSACKFEW